MKRKPMKGSATAMVVVFVIAGFLVLILGARQVYRLTTTPTWVASSDLEAGHVITAESIKRARSGDAGGIDNPRAILGMQLQVDKDKGEVFRPADLTKAPKSWLAAMVPEGRVLYTLTPKSNAIPHTQIRNGDRIDVLARGSHGVRMVARDVLLMGSLGGGADSPPTPQGRSLLTALASPSNKNKSAPTGTSLVLAVRPDDVYPLAGVGSGEEVSLVLHGDHELDSGEMLEVTPRVRFRQVEVVSGLERTQAVVRRQ